jgi:uncharacterized protein with von Willebrand factor type A (vWA) domain
VHHLLDNLVVFGRLLRSLGLDVHTGRMIDVADALRHVDLGSREDVYHACRALLAHRHDELAAFDRAFDAFWRLRPGLPHHPHRHAVAAAPPAPGDGGASGAPGAPAAGPADERVASRDGGTTAQRTWSDAAALADRDFAEFTADEILTARAALDRLVWSPGKRRTRRWVAGRGTRVDLRRALARSLRTGGDVVTIPRRRRRWRPRRLILICDVSGSMERYSRMLLHFAHAIGQQHERVEAFLFSTRLTRITTELRARRIDEAVTAVSRSVHDWSGGTRTGEALKELTQRWSRRVLHGGPVVLLVSDGWDRGDPALLRSEIARLQRSCHRLIWLNPLVGTAGYAPLTAGLQAALPFVDDFLGARTLRDLADLAIHLNAIAGAPRHR